MKEWIFIGPKLKHLFEDHDYSTKLNAKELDSGGHLEKSTETS